MDEQVEPKVEAPKSHLKKHKNKYMAGGLVAVLVACALELLPGLQELAKLKIEQAIAGMKDAGK